MSGPLAGWYLFGLGLALGLTALTATVYRKVSPRWLRWTLLGLAAAVGSRYVTMAVYALTDAPERWWWMSRCWLATSVGLTLPSVLVLDQLLRHPSWSATKVLRYFAPFVAIYAAVIVFGRLEMVPDTASGWQLELTGFWRAVLAVTQSVFVLGYLALCALIGLRMRSRRVRLALAGLFLAHLYLGVDGALLAMGVNYFRPFFFSEMLALAALGHAFDTALQRAG